MNNKNPPKPVESYLDRIINHYTSHAYTITYTHDYEDKAMVEFTGEFESLYDEYHNQFQDKDFREWDTFQDYGPLTIYRLENEIVAIYNRERFAGNVFSTKRTSPALTKTGIKHVGVKTRI
jgi:hypothetical protein